MPCQDNLFHFKGVKSYPPPQGFKMFYCILITQQDKGFQFCGPTVQICVDNQKHKSHC